MYCRFDAYESAKGGKSDRKKNNSFKSSIVVECFLNECVFHTNGTCRTREWM